MFGIKIKFEKDRPSTGSGQAPSAGSVNSPQASSGQAKELAKVKKIAPQENKFPTGQAPVAALEETAEQKRLGQAWGEIVKWALYLLIFLTPIFFLPWGVSPVAGNKQFLATVLIAIAFIAWLAKTIASGKLIWAKTPINIAVWFLVIVWATSSFLSVSKYRSIGLVGLEADSLLNIIKYALAFFLIGATFRHGSRQAFGDRGLNADLTRTNAENGRQDLSWKSLRINSGIQSAIYVFLLSITILAVFTGLKLANINFLPWDFTKTIDFNTVGTTNTLALFLGAGLMLAVGIMASRGTTRNPSTSSGQAPSTSSGQAPSTSSGQAPSTSSGQAPSTSSGQAPSTGTSAVSSVPNGSGQARNYAENGIKIGLVVLAAIIAIELVLINFNFVWWSLIGAMLFFSAYIFAREAQALRQAQGKLLRPPAGGSGQAHSTGSGQAPRIQKLIFPLVVLGISVILLLVRAPALFQFSQEVRPTNQATYSISKEVLKSKGISTDLFGSGPGTFTFDYGLYRGPLNNQNALERLFWGVRFNQGFSFVSTALATAGVLGVLALALLILSFLWQVFRRSDLLTDTEPRGSNASAEPRGNRDAGALRATFVSIAVYFFVSWFLYPANFSLLMFSFVALGLLAAVNATGEKSSPTLLYQRREEEGSSLLQREGRRDLREISLLTSPQRTMIVSLLLIVLMIGSVSLLYVESQKYVASLYFSSGLKIFSVNQNPDSALVKVGEAINLDPAVDDYQRAASQLFLVKTKNTLDSLQSASAATVESLRADFQNNMARAVSFAQQAQVLGPNESANWTNLGYVYENLLLFVDGAEAWMITAYEKAVVLEPQNPALWSDLGRAYLAAADKIQMQLNQMASAEKPDQTKIDALKQKWNENVAKSIDALSKAVQIKPDYSPAHLLLAQAYTRQGDIKNAIQKSADYYSLNPSDAGVAFQLGFLFYKDNQMANAKAVLERAVELNDNYSNARYFLGLIYDAQGNKDKAKEQFEKISELNPDNQEVKKILDNLNAGRGALETIVPPAPPPGQRTQVPVPETGGAREQTIKP